MKRLIKQGVLVDAQGEYRQDLLIENGVILERAAAIEPDGETELIDASGCYVMPGGIDVHTHFNIDVGIARSCDDFSAVPVPPPVVAPPPSSITWDLARRGAICITSWPAITTTPPHRR